MNIKIISHEIIKPSCPTPNHLRLLQASLFDQVNSPTLMPLIFFFNSQKISNKITISTNDVLDRLKGSLPKTLSVFYPLAGRILDGNYFICNDEGVPYAQAKVDLAIDDVVHKVELSELDKLLPSYGQQGFTKLLLAIQVNVFVCGGIAIGVRMNHAISDAYSFSMFVKTWASIAKNKANNHGCPNFGISKLFPPSKLKDENGKHVFANQDASLIKDRPEAKWFMFRKAKLDALMSTLSSYSTSTMVLSSFIWSRIKVACHKNVNDIPYQVFQAVNLRPKLSPIDEQSYYFGNIFVNAIAKLSMIQVVDDDNYFNESLMRDFLEKMKESITQIMDDTNILLENLQDGTEDLRFITEHYQRECRGEIIALGFSNIRSLSMYEVDFGWGKPVWVSSATLMYKNMVILIPSGPLSNDIVAYINLTEEDMAKLESDTIFTSFLYKVPHLVSSKL